MRATQRLIARGFEAYLVGGCVRDLLLGRTAKDYDIATAARPQQVKRTFPRNCRIIGRRFKLAHLHFHDNTKILEVSTFRRTPQLENNDDDDLLITRDNEFGNAEQDAMRRDFTVNALFLDPTRDTILDYTNGLADLEARVIRTIGDPRVRFREDPVRILRAAKFAGRLGFTIEDDTFAAMAETSGDLVRAAPPRLLEEILRLLRSGHSLASFQLLRDVGALHSLLPVVASFLQSARHDQRVGFWRLLEALDDRVQRGPFPRHLAGNAILLGALLVGPVLARAENNPGRSPSSIAEELLGPLGYALRLPRRDAGCLKRICGVQHRFDQGDDRKRFRVEGFVHGPYFEEALELFALRAEASGAATDRVAHWQALADHGSHGDEAAPSFDDTLGDDGPGADEPVLRSTDDFAPAVPADDDTQARDDEAETGDESVPAWPAAEGGDGRRRRRRRRRGRRRGRRDDDGPAPQDALDAGPRGAPGAGLDDEPPGPQPDQGPTIPRPRAAPRIDFAHPEGAEGSEGAVGGSEDHGPRADTGDAGDETGSPAGEPGRRRRRRRRRRRGRHRGDQGEAPFPRSEPPAPHGEATDDDTHDHERLIDAPIHADPDAPLPEVDEGPVESTEGRESTAAPAGSPQGGARGGRRRRRRGRRGGGADGGQGGGPPKQPPRHERRDNHRRGRHGAPRDVDVVPRYRDRRGKVDVIEPAPLDLSAFDVELDPKRVPTFGSIVEGKGRPKKRPPRVKDDGIDDYRPPPPPGGDSGPAAPPPPPPTDDSGGFGDW